MLETASVSGADKRATRFALLMLAFMIVPPAVLVAMSPSISKLKLATDVYNLVFSLSVAHGGLSGLFWIDRRYRRYLSADMPRNYGLFLALVVAAMAGLAMWGRPFVVGFTVLYLGWTTVHFSRQNWGVLSLVASSLDSSRPSRLEYHGCNLAGVGAAFGIVAPLLTTLGFDLQQRLWISSLGLLLVIAAFALALVAALRQVRGNAPWLQIWHTLFVGACFVPIFALDPALGLTSIGITHALQYGLIMFGLAADAREGSPWRRTVGALAAVGIYLLAFILLRKGQLWGRWGDVALIALYCVVMWHFILDAGMFRLRNPVPRAIMRQSLPYLFPSRSGAA